MKRVNTFVDFRTELVEGTEMEESSKKLDVIEEIAQENSSKRVGDELEQENANKQKGVVIDVIPLATKPPSIVEWKILKEEKKSYYQIIRAGGQSKRINAAGTKSQLLEEFMLTEKRSKTYQRKDKD
ncbi:hypothetical protein Tco_0554393 [Tanacetum coccineum]